MIKFIFKGIVRDRSKSLIPVLVITVGVMVTVLMSGFFERGTFRYCKSKRQIGYRSSQNNDPTLCRK